jgi:hypothetical protein
MGTPRLRRCSSGSGSPDKASLAAEKLEEAVRASDEASHLLAALAEPTGTRTGSHRLSPEDTDDQEAPATAHEEKIVMGRPSGPSQPIHSSVERLTSAPGSSVACCTASSIGLGRSSREASRSSSDCFLSFGGGAFQALSP